MTFGFSRDDAGKFLNSYYDAKIYENDPFAKLDQTGVGKLMDMAVKMGKAARPEMHCGICGEHGGDPTSVEFCHNIGLDYVSCSPYRVPIARLGRAGGSPQVRITCRERQARCFYRACLFLMVNQCEWFEECLIG
jgi:pyruvate,orthophosphate dikinase